MGAGRRKERQRAACILCAVFLIFLLILLIILYFSVFKPKDPKVEVPVMQLLSYSADGTPPNVTSVSLSLNLQVYIYNPNRGDFYIEAGSTACLYYEGAQVGLAAIPMGAIPSQSFNTTAVSVSVVNPIQVNESVQAGSYTPTTYLLPITTAVTIWGHVTTAGLFSHNSAVVSKCDASVALSRPSGSLQSYTCQRSYSLPN